MTKMIPASQSANWLEFKNRALELHNSIVEKEQQRRGLLRGLCLDYYEFCRLEQWQYLEVKNKTAWAASLNRDIRYINKLARLGEYSDMLDSMDAWQKFGIETLDHIVSQWLKAQGAEGKSIDLAPGEAIEKVKAIVAQPHESQVKLREALSEFADDAIIATKTGKQVLLEELHSLQERKRRLVTELANLEREELGLVEQLRARGEKVKVLKLDKKAAATKPSPQQEKREKDTSGPGSWLDYLSGALSPA
jgi:hypothetical protein